MCAVCIFYLIKIIIIYKSMANDIFQYLPQEFFWSQMLFQNIATSLQGTVHCFFLLNSSVLMTAPTNILWKSDTLSLVRPDQW